MKNLKKLFFIGSLLIVSVARAQQSSLTAYDKDLTDYPYPYSVQFITLKIQGEVLRMAFMDVKPASPNSALTYDMIYTQPVCYEFGNIIVPTLLIIGQLDRTALGKNSVPEEVRNTLGNYPKLGKLTHDKIKGSQLIELEGLGHIPHIEAFDIFIQSLLQFLKS